MASGVVWKDILYMINKMVLKILMLTLTLILFLFLVSLQNIHKKLSSIFCFFEEKNSKVYSFFIYLQENWEEGTQTKPIVAFLDHNYNFLPFMSINV